MRWAVAALVLAVGAWGFMPDDVTNGHRAAAVMFMVSGMCVHEWSRR